jgi:predicted nucleic acid-binding protein
LARERQPGVVVLDSGAITKVAAGTSVDDDRWRILHQRGWLTAIPAAALAETMTGTPIDARVHRLLKAVGGAVPCDERLGRLAGGLRARAFRTGRTPSGIDAIVAATAMAVAPSVVLTTDPLDLAALLADEQQVAVAPV